MASTDTGSDTADTRTPGAEGSSSAAAPATPASNASGRSAGRRSNKGPRGGGVERVSLFVSGMPVAVAAKGFKRQLRAAFQPFHRGRSKFPVVKVAVNEHNHAKGYAFVTLHAPAASAAHTPAAAEAPAPTAAEAPTPATSEAHAPAASEGHAPTASQAAAPEAATGGAGGKDGAGQPPSTRGGGAAGAAAAAIAALDGKLTVGNDDDQQVVRVSLTTGLRDTLWQDTPYDIRRQLRLDAVAEYSVLDQSTAVRISDLLARVLAVGIREGVKGPEECRVVDGTACVGGWSLALGRWFNHVMAVEFDAGRAEMLSENVRLCGLEGKVEARCGDAVALLSSGEEMRADLVVFDPPWGGPGYGELDVIGCHEFKLGSTPLTELCATLRRSGACSSVVLRLPTNFDLDGFARHATTEAFLDPDSADAPSALPRERTLPFRIPCGKKAVLLLLCFPPHPARAEGSADCKASFGDAKLDAIVDVLKKFNKQYRGEHKAKFWDYEASGGAGAWIRCGAWHGVAPLPRDAGASGAGEGE